MSAQDSAIADNWRTAKGSNQGMKWRDARKQTAGQWLARIHAWMTDLEDDGRPVTLTRVAQDRAGVPEGATLLCTTAEDALWRGCEAGILQWDQSELRAVQFRIRPGAPPPVTFAEQLDEQPGLFDEETP